MSDQLPLGFDAPPPKAWRSAALRSLHLRSHAAADEATERDEKARQQDLVVFRVFERTGRRLTPSEVHAILQDDGLRILLTSVRRALTNLCDSRRYDPPLLVHHPKDRRPGPFGAKESTWGLAG